MLFGLTLTFLVSQIFAGIAIISDLVGFQMKKREHILLFCAFTVSCLSLHHFLLGNIAACAILGLAVLRYIISIFYPKKWILIVFLLLSIVVFLITYEKLADILILLGTLFLTIAAFQKNEESLRIINMFGFSFYIIFNIVVFSPFATLARLSVFCSNAIGYYRHHYRNK